MVQDRSGTPRIAVLMTCHNRREMTLSCLAALRGQIFFRPDDLFLVDDGSTDGTGEAVKGILPEANVIPGDGSLFWNGGMRLAWSTAIGSATKFDYFLWLNDDVLLEPDAVPRLVETARSAARRDEAVIVAGTTIEEATGTPTYGAHRASDRSRPLRLRLVQPGLTPQPVDTVSGNIVLVSRSAADILGMLDSRYVHIYGDLDYGLRARDASIPVILGAGTFGTCAANSTAGGSLDESLGRIRRLRIKFAERRRVHTRDWAKFARRFSGLGWFSFLYSVSPYARILMRPRKR